MNMFHLDDIITPEHRKNALDSLRALVYPFAEKVAPAYAALNWEWVGGIPAVEEIAELCNRFISNLIKSPEVNFMESGGIQVGIENDDNMVKPFIRFKLESARYFSLKGCLLGSFE